MGQVRRALFAVGLVLALMPLSAFAEDGNQAAIDAAKAEKQWLMSMPVYPQGVAMGQLEINNARAIAKLLSYDAHAQTEIPNSLEQYRLFCGAAIDHLQSKLTNANAMVAMRPWDTHAQAEVANADAKLHTLWDMIGDSYPGNPYHQVRSPSQYPVYGDDGTIVAADDEQVMAAADDEVVAEDAEDTGAN